MGETETHDELQSPSQQVSHLFKLYFVLDVLLEAIVRILVWSGLIFKLQLVVIDIIVWGI